LGEIKLMMIRSIPDTDVWIRW